MSALPTRIDLLELDIDLRLAALWQELHKTACNEAWPEETLEAVAAYMRAAYGKGYCDALTEETRAELCLEHGYDPPDAPSWAAQPELKAA